MQSPELHQQVQALGLLSLVFASCGQAAAEAPGETQAPSVSVMTEIQSANTFPIPMAQGQAAQQPTKRADLPRPEVELPELPYDKSELKQIQKLDVMLVHAGHLAAAAELAEGYHRQLKQAAETSLNGTKEDQLRGLMSILDGFENFDREGKAVAVQASAEFHAHYEGDEAFTRTYRETYSLAEEELYEVIKDGVVRRATSAAMGNTYRYPPGVNVSYLDEQIEGYSQMRIKAIERVIAGTATDLMVVDYKKGKALVDLLQVTRSKLALVEQLDPGNAAISAALDQVAEKEAARQGEIEKAREDYRFPQRHAGGNAVANPEGLEEAMRHHLEASGYEVQAIAVASAWVPVHSPLGVHLCNQVDFTVATTAHIESEAKAGILDVSFVTGKTMGPALEVPFRAYSIGSLAQMRKQNL